MTRQVRRYVTLLLVLIFSVSLALPQLWKVYYRVDHIPSILEAARSQHLSPHLVASVIFVESRFRETALSDVGACGLMQLMPETAEEVAEKLDLLDFHPTHLYEPNVNITLGTAYLRELFDRFDSEEQALAAYNAGPSLVYYWQQNPKVQPYLETQAFVRLVQTHRSRLEKLYPNW